MLLLRAAALSKPGRIPHRLLTSLPASFPAALSLPWHPPPLPLTLSVRWPCPLCPRLLAAGEPLRTARPRNALGDYIYALSTSGIASGGLCDVRIRSALSDFGLRLFDAMQAYRAAKSNADGFYS